jgi:hypothetical protein
VKRKENIGVEQMAEMEETYVFWLFIESFPDYKFYFPEPHFFLNYNFKHYF